jgi:hypothetical protein
MEGIEAMSGLPQAKERQGAPNIRLLDCTAAEVSGVTLAKLTLDIDGTSDTLEVRSGLGEDHAIHSAIQQMLQHDAELLMCSVEEEGGSFRATVRLGCHGQQVACHADDKGRAKAIALAYLDALAQTSCAGPTH